MTADHGAVENQGIGTFVSNLAFTAGSRQWMGGTYPAAVLARAD
jgi:hypothetical protein